MLSCYLLIALLSFCSNSYFSSLTKNILEFCKDHSGSRIIQKRFEEGTEQDKLWVKLYDELVKISRVKEKLSPADTTELNCVGTIDSKSETVKEEEIDWLTLEADIK